MAPTALQASLARGPGQVPPPAGAPSSRDHPGSQEHTCHGAGPTVPATTRGSAKGALPRGSARTTRTPPLPAEKKGEKYFSAEAAFALPGRPAQGMPSPQVTSPSLRGARPPGPADPAVRSPPGVRLPSLLQFGGRVWGCSGHCRRRLRCYPGRSRHRSAARGWGPAGSREVRGRARRGRAAGSCRREARSGRGASRPRPSSHNFAAREGAGSGPREARGGRGRRGGRVSGAGGTGT